MVVGASMAGLLTIRVLIDRFKTVTLGMRIFRSESAFEAAAVPPRAGTVNPKLVRPQSLGR